MSLLTGSHVWLMAKIIAQTPSVYWAFRSVFNINSGKNDSQQSHQNKAYTGSPQAFAHKQGSAYKASLRKTPRPLQGSQHPEVSL